jgi:3-hydroxyanthranilate 3,4-dioxygenase
VLVLERPRRPGEDDRFTWFCASCGAELHRKVAHVADYRADPVSRAYEEFYGSESSRTCGRCGHVTPRPAPRR